MAYVGRGIDKISNVEVLDNITFSGASSYTLQKGSVNYVPSSSANLLISIDGVVQANNFTINGSTIDFGVAVANTSTCNFILHYGVGVITTPQDGSVTTVKIGDDAVTYAKLQNLATANRVLGSASTGLIGETQVATAMVSDDAITYAKMQDTSAANKVLGAVSAGTVGEVSIATDMIADAQVDEAKLKISNNPTNGYFLSAQSGNTGGMTWAEAGGGLTVADQWRLTTTFTGSINPIASNLERIDTTAGGQVPLGSAMTVASGIFTFPSTGYYLVQYNLLQQSTDGVVRGYGGGAIFATIDNSSYVTVAQTFGATPAISGTSRMSNSCSTIIDVTNVSNVKVKFSTEMQNSGMGTMGSTESNQTHMTFLRLGDT